MCGEIADDEKSQTRDYNAQIHFSHAIAIAAGNVSILDIAAILRFKTDY
jgi:hypothetical protein